MRRNPFAFTLIELLVVVSIIALLIAILLPSLAKAREQSKIIVCSTNERTLMQSTIMYSLDYKGRAPLHGAGPFVDGYPVAPFWDYRLTRYVGTAEYDPHIFSCPGVLSAWDKTDKKNARTYRMNLIVGGWDAKNNVNTDQPLLSDFKISDRTIVYGESWNVWTFNVIYGWNIRRWYDIAVAHLWEDDFVTTAWGERPARGGSNFAFVDGHVAFYRHIDGWVNNRVDNLIINPDVDF